MKTIRFSKGFVTGIVFGIVLTFLFLIGFIETGSGLLSKLFGQPVPTNAMPKIFFVVLFFVLIGMWAGSSLVRKYREEPFKDLLPVILVGGLTFGAIMGIVAFIFGSIAKAGIDVRTYLVAVSPALIGLLMLKIADPTIAALSLLTLFTLATLLGAFLEYLWQRRLSGKAKELKGCVSKRLIRFVPQHLFEKPAVKYATFVIALALFILLPRVWGSYWNYVLGTVGIYILLGLGLNIITGWTGQLVIGYVAFFAVGTYTFALLTAPEPHGLMLNFWLALAIAVGTSALVGFLIGLPILNLRGDYLAIVTLGFAEIIRILLKSDLLTWFTGGPRGIRDVGGPTLFGMVLNDDVNFTYLIFIMVLLMIFFVARLQRSRTGRGWEAIREDQTVAKATGVNTFSSKLLALTLSAAAAGLAGALFASRNQFTGPEDHVLLVAINVMCLMIVGGIGNIPGIVLGALVLKGLPEILREISNFRMLAFGALLVVMMLMRPEGFLPAKRPKISKPEVPDSAQALKEDQGI